MKPLVSVIIPNYNYERYLREAIDSALGQTYPNIEIIVVDDGSTDDSRQIIESYGREIRAVFQQNQGVSAARNSGVVQSKGEFVAFLDADDIWLPEKIESQVARFEQDRDLGLVHVWIVDVDADTCEIEPHLDGKEGWVAEALLLGEPVIYGGGSGFLVRRTVLDDVGVFDTNLSTSADWDIFVRIAIKYRFGIVNRILLKYRIHDSNMHQNVERMEREILIGYEKAFNSGNVSIDGIRRKSYGNLHKTLAGSYFYLGNYGKFVSHVLKSILLTPGAVLYFASFPIRRIKHKLTR